MSLKTLIGKFTKNCWDKKEKRTDMSIKEQMEQVKKAVAEADAVIIGAGAGLSTAAGFVYAGERFHEYFQDFIDEYGFTDMYSGGFYPFETLEEHWAYWSRYIYINRYMDTPKPLYEKILELVKEKEYFVLTTNVDHCFQKAGFDKNRLFYTQGDFGLWQCSKPCHPETYDNERIIRRMVEEQKDRRVPTELVPHCPNCGKPMSMNLRADMTFVEDEGWHRAATRYENFLKKYAGKKVVFLEMGVGMNTPVIIKYPFWRMTYQNPEAVYVCMNYGEAGCPEQIQKQSICINGDIWEMMKEI